MIGNMISSEEVWCSCGATVLGDRQCGRIPSIDGPVTYASVSTVMTVFLPTARIERAEANLGFFKLTRCTSPRRLGGGVAGGGL